MIQVCDLSFANSSITDTLGNYSLVSSGTVTISSHTYPANTDPILYGTDSSYNYVEFGQTATYSNGAIIQAGVPTYGSENWSVEFRARIPSVPPGDTGPYVLFFGCEAPYDDNGTTRTGGYWAISIDASLDTPDELRFFYDFNNEDLTIKDNLDFTAWHLYKVTKTAEDILTLHIDGVLVATIDIEQQTGFKSRATLGSFALLGAVEEFPTTNRIRTNQFVRLADVKVYADPMGHAEKAISLDNLSRVFRNYNTWLSSQLGGAIGNGTLTIQKNGTNVATFTANQSTAATANITVPTAVSELTNDSGYLTASSNLDASKLTSGTVDIARLPQGALERLVKVANEAARYALTIADVQLGDTVQQLDTGIMYVVTDTDHLDSAAGYTEYTAGTAASVPWSGVTGKPTFAAVATSGAYSDLTGTPTIPTVNNATLTIQQNGTTVDSFGANSSSDKTVNIQCVDLTNNQTVAGDKEFIGTTTAHDVVPSATDTYNLGSPSYQWNNLYAKNYYYNGVAWGLGQANVWDTYQTIKGYYFGNEQSTNGRTCLYLTSNRDTVGQSGIYITKFRQNRAQGAMNPADSQYIAFDVLENSIRTNGVLQLNITNWNADGDVPSGAVLFSNLSNAQLGSSLIPWKTLNGINPGALSLPSTTGLIDISSSITSLDGATINNFTPQVDGWLLINGTGVANDGFIYAVQGRIGMMSASNTTMLGCAVLIPVVAGVQVSVTCKLNTLTWANIVPCQGNV